MKHAALSKAVIAKIIKAAIASGMAFHPAHYPTLKFMTVKEVTCLAKNLYFEARGEGVNGMAPVALVTRNRVMDPRFPHSFCAVIHERNQFSWTRLPAKQRVIKDQTSFESAAQVASWIISGRVSVPEFVATHYFNPSAASPEWQREFSYQGQVGHHAFFYAQTAMR